MNKPRTFTPITWIQYVHSLPLDDYGAKLDRRTRKACQGQANVASICLLGLAAFSAPATLAEVKKVVAYNITPTSFDRLVLNGLVNLVPGANRTWQLNRIGRQIATKIQADLDALIKKLTQTPTESKP
jgi:hypothetical protein